MKRETDFSGVTMRLVLEEGASRTRSEQGRRDYTKFAWDPKPRNLGGRQVLSNGVEKFTAVSLLRDARPDSAQKTGRQGHRFPIHRCTVGPRRHFDGRRESLHAWTRGVPCGCSSACSGSSAASPQTVDLEQVPRGQLASATAVPSHCPTNWPTSSPAVAASRGAGRDEDPPAVGLLTGSILQLRITRAPGDATDPIAQEVAPAGRCRCSTWATSV